MDKLLEKQYKEQLAWAQQRLEALEQIETKLKTMRELAIYAASHTLTEEEMRKNQEWLDVLQAEINELEAKTTWNEFPVPN